MKKRKIYGLAIVVLALCITLGSFFATENPYYDIYKKYEASLNTQEQMQLENFVDHMYYGMPDKYVDLVVLGLGICTVTYLYRKKKNKK